MSAQILSGKEIAAKRKDQLKKRVSGFVEKGLPPGLATILVGENPSSVLYVKNKIKACESTGIRSFHYHFPETTTQEELLQFLEQLNSDDQIHGILVQLPLPPHFQEEAVLSAIAPEKDADGFHPINLGRLLQKKHLDLEKSSFPLPCTPAGCLVLLQETGISLAGKRAVVVGRSTIVGKPMALLLLASDATVTLCHSRTRDLPAVTREADILVAALGKPETITGEMVKEGAIVIDVGINRTEKGLRGDVSFEEVKEKAAFITPVPGGVGPMTVQMLLENTVANYVRKQKLVLT